MSAISRGKYFYCAAFADCEVQAYLDALKILCNPAEIEAAHVTLRGPYGTRQKVRYPKYLQGKPARIEGVGQFINPMRWTIFLHVRSPIVDSYVYQPEFEKPVPHVTIYNGRCRVTAEHVAAALRRPSIVLRARLSEVTEVYVRNNKVEKGLGFLCPLKAMSAILGESLESAVALPLSGRLPLIRQLCSRLSRRP